jgi:hypothetical protein
MTEDEYILVSNHRALVIAISALREVMVDADEAALILIIRDLCKMRDAALAAVKIDPEPDE